MAAGSATIFGTYVTELEKFQRLFYCVDLNHASGSDLIVV